jgi:hypothetical protein
MTNSQSLVKTLDFQLHIQSDSEGLLYDATLEAVAGAARRAAERARTGDRAGADRQLATVAERLDRVTTRIAEAGDDLPDPLSNAARNRVEQANRRTTQARNSKKL